MSHSSNRKIAAIAWLCAALWSAAGCEPKRVPPMSVGDLMEDRVTLDGVLLKCNADADAAHSDQNCMNARIAVERLAKERDPADEARRNAEFERSRERLRLAEDKARAEHEAQAKVDAYDLPVVPVEGAPGGAAASAAASAVPPPN